jgi:hypothetical protein
LRISRSKFIQNPFERVAREEPKNPKIDLKDMSENISSATREHTR